MSVDAKPLSLYRSFNCFQYYMSDRLGSDIMLNIKKYYIAQIPIYDECRTRIANDLFPTKIYRQLKLMKDSGLGDYKVGGSAALKLATADNTWENDDVDIMVRTEMKTLVFAAHLGLDTLNALTKSWTRNVDPINPDTEEKFHDSIYQVLTFQYNDFDKKIQLVFFKEFGKSSFTDFLDTILDYPAHVLYEVDFDKDDKKIYNFFLPVKMWKNIVQKQIPRNLHCVRSKARIKKYMNRGFEFFRGTYPPPTQFKKLSLDSE